ncbi:MAG: DUF6524 family protein [candidate division KSB1 bacterium]|nr:DUF6524 family protein [candidate division KSB1 bacterium]MDZ7300878.1 DUF6524 family protein [candidate division KSB1 bacterium]MDZ7309852.1 DUF6524 family protein [candidate division KSB1 bacterium]
MTKDDFNWSGIGIRFLMALLLVYATFNPEGYSFFHWALLPLFKVKFTSFGAINPLKVLAGLALLSGWVIYLQATKRSLGIKGVLLSVALFGAIIWVLIYWNILSPKGARALSHLILIVVALVLTIGMSWSHITRRISGQVDTDTIA